MTLCEWCDDEACFLAIDDNGNVAARMCEEHADKYGDIYGDLVEA